MRHRLLCALTGVLLVPIGVLSLTACGSKGDLYLPPEAAAPPAEAPRQVPAKREATEPADPAENEER